MSTASNSDARKRNEEKHAEALRIAREDIGNLARQLTALPYRYSRAAGENGDRVADLLTQDAYAIGQQILQALEGLTV